MLLREVEDESSREPTLPSAQWSLEDVLQRAENFGVRGALERVCLDLNERGYRTNVKKTGLNFNRGSRLQTFWVRPVEAGFHIGYLAGNFPALFGVDESEAEKAFGANWIDLSPDAACERIRLWADEIDGMENAMRIDEATNDLLAGTAE